MSKANRTQTLASRYNLTERNGWHIQPGDTLYTKRVHRSKSGMMRVYDVYIARDNRIFRITWTVAAAIGWVYNELHEGVQVNGMNFDGSSDIVSELSQVLFSDPTLLRRERL